MGKYAERNTRVWRIFSNLWLHNTPPVTWRPEKRSGVAIKDVFAKLNPTTTTEQESTTTETTTTDPITSTVTSTTQTTAHESTSTTETTTTDPMTSTDTSASQTTDETSSNPNTQLTTVTLYSSLPTTTASGGSANGLSTGAKAGIGVGVSLGAVLIIVGAIFLFRRYQGRRNGGLKATPVSEGTTSPAEMEATERRVFELSGRNRSQLSPSEVRKEMYELEAS
ncbi:hypothetical protein BDW59DRAFT_163567 [Aspergillus cavernicola]|uniref:Mid2 domain-containing protein n=1 Tax=Aspergillus cavernicola TaxID=176166 RepID=A0ABR4I4S0_9EURO